METVVTTVRQKTHDELIQSFETKRKEYEERKQREHEDIRNDLENQIEQFVSNTNEMKNKLEEYKQMTEV